MKRSLIALALALVMMCTVCLMIPVEASAASINITLTEGVYAEQLIFSAGKDEDIVHYETSGSIPGMGIASNGSSMILIGSPTEPGWHTMDLILYVQKGTTELTATITIDANVNASAITLSTVTKSYTVGDKVDFELDMSTGGEVMDGSYSGTLPAGVHIDFYDTGARISGQVTMSGSYTVTISVFDDHSQGWRHQSVVFYVEDPVQDLEITKDPTGEIITEGGSAMFIARADNADTMEWYLISPDGSTTYRCAEASHYIPGLSVSGSYEETLVLSNIPLSMNGWEVIARFDNIYFTKWTETAALTVMKAPPRKPIITVQPVEMELQEGSSGKLTAQATSPDGVKVAYQWYQSKSEQTSGGEKISGATENTYTPQYQEGVRYFYCEVWCVEGNLKSDVVKTLCVSVTGIPKETETQAPETTEATKATEPETTAPTQTEETKKPVETEPVPVKKEGPPVGLIVALIIVVALVLVVGTALITVIILKKKESDEDEDAFDEE